VVINALAEFIATCAQSWERLIIYGGSFLPMRHSWTVPLMMICNIVASNAEQCLLVHRYYRLSRRMSLTSLVVFMILLQDAAGVTVAVDLILHAEYGRRFTVISATVEYCLSAIVDIFIPILLIWELRKIQPTYSCTKSLIRGIIVTAASSGCCVALAEILLLILFWTRRPVMVLVDAAVGPLYGITVLTNLFVWQRRPCPGTSRAKTDDLTTLDSLQLQQYTYPLSPSTP